MKTLSAIISHIQPFSVGDGPGIRTTVFFKGCNLHCPWCHNPETISPNPEILYAPNLCMACGRCAEACSTQAHRLNGHSHLFNRDACTACGKCVSVCPTKALSISGSRWTVPELLDKVRQDEPFYRHSAGGITLSGGEPLLQVDFCAEFARQCQASGLSVLVDTAASVPYASFQKLMPYTDLFYVDIKAAAEDEYQNIIGGSLKKVLANLSALHSDGAQAVIRIPVIPGLTDKPGYGKHLSNVLRPTGFRKVDLLPFHKLCIGKYEALNRQFPCSSLVPPTETTMHRIADEFSDAFSVSIQM